MCVKYFNNLLRFKVVIDKSCRGAFFSEHSVEALEKVQKRATKILPHLKHLKYSERLRVCELPTLH